MAVAVAPEAGAATASGGAGWPGTVAPVAGAVVPAAPIADAAIAVVPAAAGRGRTGVGGQG
ncbi:MAG: hypothetical protein ACRYGC_12765 [Janthinobacterium lividum]